MSEVLFDLSIERNISTLLNMCTFILTEQQKLAHICVSAAAHVHTGFAL